MYGIFTYIWLDLYGKLVVKYTKSHGSYGYGSAGNGSHGSNDGNFHAWHVVDEVPGLHPPGGRR